MVDWRHVNAVPRLNCNASIHSHHQPTFVYPRSIWFDSSLLDSLLDRWYHYSWYYAMFLKNIFVIFIIHRPQYYSQALHLPRPIPITQIHSYWSTPYWAQHIHRMSTELHAFCLNWSRVLFRISDGMWSIATLSVRIRGTTTLIQPDHLSLWFSLDSWVLNNIFISSGSVNLLPRTYPRYWSPIHGYQDPIQVYTRQSRTIQTSIYSRTIWSLNVGIL